MTVKEVDQNEQKHLVRSRLHYSLCSKDDFHDDDASSSYATIVWDLAQRQLASLPFSEHGDSVNPNSLAVAKSLLTHLAATLAVPPAASLDADGDVLLHWISGPVKRTMIVTGETLSGVVTEGNKVAFIGKDWPANINALLAFGPSGAESTQTWTSTSVKGYRKWLGMIKQSHVKSSSPNTSVGTQLWAPKVPSQGHSYSLPANSLETDPSSPLFGSISVLPIAP